MATQDPTPAPASGGAPRWEVIASRPDYSQRGSQGRFTSLDDAEEAAETLRAQGYRDVQVEPIPDGDGPS